MQKERSTLLNKMLLDPNIQIVKSTRSASCRCICNRKENSGCQLIRSPSNIAMMAGQRLELTCQPDINYTVREWISSNQAKIYTDWSSPRIVGSQRFGYIKNNNSVTLYLNTTELDDAGNYNCSFQLESKQLEHYSAQIIILETEPVCEDNITTASNVSLEEGSIVWMRCSLNFRGNLAPTMEWRQHGQNIDIDNRTITDMVETSVVPNANISSTLTVVVKPTYNATFFTCKTYFQWTNTSSPNSTAATNAPDYSYTWNSSVIIVPATIFDQEGTSTVSAPASALTSSLTTVYASITVLSIVIVAVAITVCVCIGKKFRADAVFGLGSTEKTEETTTDSKPVVYENVAINETLSTGDSQAAAYMQLTFLTKAPPPIYESIDIAGKMLELTNNPSSDYENIPNASS